MAVWLLTGIWHGSTLNFPVWGLFLGLIICVEKLTGLSKAKKNILSWLATIILIVISWVIFNSKDLPSALTYIGQMFGASPFVMTSTIETILHDTWYVIASAILGCAPVIQTGFERLFKDPSSKTAMTIKSIVMLAFLALSMLVLVNSSYSAFIYTKF